MGILLDKMKAIASQIQLSSPLGQWIEAVSAALDGESSDGGVQTTLGEYIQTEQQGASPSIGANQDITLDTVLSSRGITYAPATGIYTLVAGKTYRLAAHGRFSGFSNATGGNVNLDWVDAATNVALPGSVLASVRPTTSTDATSSSHELCEAIFTPSSTNNRVKLRSGVGTVGTANLVSQEFTAIIQQIL